MGSVLDDWSHRFNWLVRYLDNHLMGRISTSPDSASHIAAARNMGSDNGSINTIEAIHSLLYPVVLTFMSLWEVDLMGAR